MARPADVVLLAIETYVGGPKGLDTSREQPPGHWSAKRYTLRDWAVDVIGQLPPDRERARLIVEAHHQGGRAEMTTAQRRRVGRYCGQFYRRLRECGLLSAGERFLEMK